MIEQLKIETKNAIYDNIKNMKFWVWFFVVLFLTFHIWETNS